MKNTGLALRPVPAVSVPHACPRSNSSYSPDCMCSLDVWQPEWVLVLVSHKFKKTAIVDLVRPSDAHPDQLRAAAVCKQDGYNPLVAALSHYVDSGCTVHLVLCKVGVRHSAPHPPAVQVVQPMTRSNQHRKLENSSARDFLVGWLTAGRLGIPAARRVEAVEKARPLARGKSKWSTKTDHASFAQPKPRVYARVESETTVSSKVNVIGEICIVDCTTSVVNIMPANGNSGK
jgi:hypothetical protein